MISADGVILGIETATWTASVAVCRGDTILAERWLSTQGSHGLSLVPLIEQTLADACLSTDDLDGVAVSIGPGSFTGLRVGVATAKGLAFACGIPLAGVRTLAALALAAGVEDGFVCPMLDARKGEVYAALVEMSAGKGNVVQPEVAIALERWLPLVGSRPCTFVGDAVELVRPAARADWTLLPFERFPPRGAMVARLGGERLRRGDADDFVELEPFYARPSEAELRYARPATA